ncbi:MAG: DUF2807 domain-containing protein [Chlamydiales bacterium]|nr:DUF2807 domain-containing protein [Chlamydiales bacterium]
MRAFFCLFLPFLVQLSAVEARTVLISKSVNYIEEIDFQGVGKLIIREGERAGLQIEGDEEIVHDTKIRVQAGALRITRRDTGFRQPSSSLVCTVTVTHDFRKLTLKGDALLETERLVLPNLQADLHDRSSGLLFLTGGNFSCRIYDAARLTTQGSVKRQEVLVEDMGEYRGAGLDSRVCEVKVVGQGVADVEAEEKLSAFVLGQGRVNYTAEPRELEKRVSGTGQITLRSKT